MLKKEAGIEEVDWNFGKFLVKGGNVKWYGARTDPVSRMILAELDGRVWVEGRQRKGEAIAELTLITMPTALHDRRYRSFALDGSENPTIRYQSHLYPRRNRISHAT